MKISLAQMKVNPKQLEGNFQTIKYLIEQAKQQGSDCIVFPELAVSGYLLGDLWYSSSFISQCEAYNEKIVVLSDDIIVIWGNVTSCLEDYLKGNDGRQALYNCAFIAHNGKYLKRENGSTLPYVKNLLPNYRIFDDARYFVSGQKFSVDLMYSPFIANLNNHNVKIALEVCEDLWSEHYDVNPTALWGEKHIDLLVNISSSPWTENKERARDNHLINMTKKYKVPFFVYVNTVGMQNTGKNVVLFDGGSKCISDSGQVVSQCNDVFEQELNTFDLNQFTSKNITYHQDKLLDAIVIGIKEFDHQIFKGKVNWIIGLSGGIDSSVSAALLVLAVGAKRVLGVNMPSKYNKQTTIKNAMLTAKRLGIEYIDAPIESLVDATTAVTKLNDENANSIEVVENTQARIRGHLLSTIAAIRNGVVVNNGNKVETALGYCTIYGDTIGALSPLGDCTKMQVFELARQLNKRYKNEIIPENLIPKEDDHGLSFEFMPSAELKDNQIDPMKWGYHDYLVQIYCEYPSYGFSNLVSQYKDGSIWEQPVSKWLKFYNLVNDESFIDDLKWVTHQIQSSVFKRIQMPPVILVSKGAFGSDFRENQGIYSCVDIKL
jgi:NAD+ synthase (glutamine-hydrolysing)